MILLDRKQIIQRRCQLDPSIKKSKEREIQKYLEPYLHGNIGLYVPIKNEVDLFSLNRNRKLYLPKVTSSTTMEFLLFTGTFSEGAFGVLEPEGARIDPIDLDVIVVPMVAFNGLQRMGYGKGYYDRYLKDTKALKVGVAFSMQEANFEKQDHDINMDIVITEFGILKE